MSKPSDISTPTETIELPSPSWAPAVFALGVLGLIAGTFANGFMFPAWCYAAVGAVLAIAALISMARRGRRAFYRLPRTSPDRHASLPVESFGAPPRD